jgi:hypothetical protein
MTGLFIGQVQHFIVTDYHIGAAFGFPAEQVMVYGNIVPALNSFGNDAIS